MNKVTIPFNTATAKDYLFPGVRELVPSKLPIVNFVVKAVPEVLKDIPSAFVTVLAHEVRNPLTNINLAVEVLAAKIQEPALQNYLDVIMRGSMRINGLMNELFAYQHEAEIKTESCSLIKLLDEVLEMARDRISLKHIRVVRFYEPGDFMVVLNRLKIKIALTNIVINAIDSISGANGELKLFIKSDEENYSVQIEDNGCGISSEHLKCIFDPYFTNKPGGLGIGLAATYDILHANKVGVTIESDLAKGTHFVLLFNRNR
jgi:signal transduction histidine kinase